MQSIKDNVSLLDEETINKINEVVVRAGHQLVKKKDEGFHIKADTYVLETDVHFPTDVNLLWDAGCKRLDMIEDAIGEGLAQGQLLEARVKETDEDQHEGVVWRWKK